MSFDKLSEQYIRNLGFEAMNELQQKMVAEAKSHKSIMLHAPTGSGKTVAFLLPAISNIKKNLTGVQVLILVPSRELALQIEQVAKTMGTGYKIISCYGGHPMRTENKSFTEPPQVVIGTPGRIAAHLRRGSFETANIHTLVLDEFDKSLEFGFETEMSNIMSHLRSIRDKILTSATQAISIPDFVRVKNPFVINILPENQPNKVQFRMVRAIDNDKLAILFQLLCFLGNETTLVFCNHREAVERIGDLLTEKEIAHDIFHGGMEQPDRERALIKFRNRSCNILLTTDLASRGLDIPEIRNIIHYQPATTETAYIHRNGRTARMHANGTIWHILAETENLHDYITQAVETYSLPDMTHLPEKGEWGTIFIGGGKKDKINKIDIVGFLIHKGGLAKEEIGLINVLDFQSFAAVKRTKLHKVVQLLRNEKIKNKKVKVVLSD